MNPLRPFDPADPADPRHATPRGYQLGCRAACCAGAMAAYANTPRRRLVARRRQQLHKLCTQWVADRHPAVYRALVAHVDRVEHGERGRAA